MYVCMYVRDFWIRETGTGQQVAQLHDRYMMIYSHFEGIHCLFHLQSKRLLVYPEDSERVLLETWVDLYHTTGRHTSKVNNFYLTL